MKTLQFLARSPQVARCRVATIALFAALAVAPATTPAWAADPVQIPATTTTLVSDADRMISYRHGERMWQTDDGATHLLINQGSIAPTGTSLQLFSSFDGGQTWASSAWINDTNQNSTTDGVLTGNSLEVVYSVAGGQIAYTQLNYEPGTRIWTNVTTETVFASPGVTAINPAMAIDGQGGRWCGFVSTDNTTLATNIRLASRGVGAPAWTDTGLVFGQTDYGLPAVERSARPVNILGGVGMVYTVHEKLFWAMRLNSQPPGAAWINEQLLFAGAPPFDTDPFSSHFSIAADSKKNLHLTTVDHGVLYYFRFASKNRTWSAPKAMTQDISAGYPQVTVATGDTVVLLVNKKTQGAVLQSTNGGNTFTFSHLLTHAQAPAGSGLNYGYPRIESPGKSAEPVPVLQQYEDGTTERLMFFSVPVLPGSGTSGGR